MTYDFEFFELYRQYLDDPIVRERHGLAFRLFDRPAFNKVLDLGCGSGEYWRYFLSRKTDVDKDYLGIDQLQSPDVNSAVFDYRSHAFLEYVTTSRRWTGFVSLFSSEITAPVEENYELYSSIFSNPSFQAGLVSGFYYQSKRHINPVEETGGLLSYQTLKPLGLTDRFLPDDVTETRLELCVPSELFGPDVVEVWKLFERL